MYACGIGEVFELDNKDKPSASNTEPRRSCDPNAPVDKPSFHLHNTSTSAAEPKSSKGNRCECRADGEEDAEQQEFDADGDRGGTCQKLV